MPIYEYHCTACETRKEHLQKMHAEPLVTCPTCGQDTYVKLISAAGFQLKGTGWYVTDFRDQGQAPAKASDTGAAAASTPAPSTGCSTSCTSQ